MKYIMNLCSPIFDPVKTGWEWLTPDFLVPVVISLSAILVAILISKRTNDVSSYPLREKKHDDTIIRLNLFFTNLEYLTEILIPKILDKGSHIPSGVEIRNASNEKSIYTNNNEYISMRNLIESQVIDLQSQLAQSGIRYCYSKWFLELKRLFPSCIKHESFICLEEFFRDNEKILTILIFYEWCHFYCTEDRMLSVFLNSNQEIYQKLKPSYAPQYYSAYHDELQKHVTELKEITKGMKKHVNGLDVHLINVLDDSMKFLK